MTTDPLNGIQSLFSPVSATAGGRKHYLSPRSMSGIANGHSINSVIEAFSKPTLSQQIMQPIKEALTPPASLTTIRF
jgi:hypothetical protein